MAEYEYDGDGTRISKTQNGVKTKYINDVGHGLTQVIMETTEANTVQAVYTYGDDLISMKRNSGISEICGYYHYDGLGTVKQMTDSNGAVVEKYQYDAFGNSTIFSPSNEPRDTSSLGNAHGFTGEQQFGEADDLVFLRARYYDSSTGRFISRDPIGYRGGLNVYAYCRNNPINYVDPYGNASTGRAILCGSICTPIAALAYDACLAGVGSRCPGAGAYLCRAAQGAVMAGCMAACMHFDPDDIYIPSPPVPVPHPYPRLRDI